MSTTRSSLPNALKVFLWISIAVVGFIGVIAYSGGTKRAALSARGMTASVQVLRRETVPATKKRKACQIAVYAFQPQSGPAVEGRTTCHEDVPAEVTYLPDDPSRYVPGRVEADFSLASHVLKACAFVFVPLATVFGAITLWVKRRRPRPPGGQV